MRIVSSVLVIIIVLSSGFGNLGLVAASGGDGESIMALDVCSQSHAGGIANSIDILFVHHAPALAGHFETNGFQSAPTQVVRAHSLTFSLDRPPQV